MLCPAIVARAQTLAPMAERLETVPINFRIIQWFGASVIAKELTGFLNSENIPLETMRSRSPSLS